MSKAAAIAAEMPRLRRYARALMRDAVAADDLVQDCLVRALANKSSWREDASPRKWLFTILHNLHIDGARRRKRQPRQVDLDSADADRHLSGEYDASGMLDIEDALARLSVEQRQALLLVALEGLSYAETADVLGVPIGTVMSRIARGRERLRQTLYGEPGNKTRLKRVK